MTSKQLALNLFLLGGLWLSRPAPVAAEPLKYQVSGEVVEVNDTTLSLRTTDRTWTVVRVPTTRVSGDLRVGARVTVQYTLTASSIEAARPEKGPTPEPKSDRDKKARKKVPPPPAATRVRAVPAVAGAGARATERGS